MLYNYSTMQQIAIATRNESAEHAAAKLAVRDAARAIGAQAECEVSGSDWQADVLVTYGGKRFAFEIEWSGNSPKDARRRQARYLRDGITGLWFFHNIPGSRTHWSKTPFTADPSIPVFGIEPSTAKLDRFTIYRHSTTHDLDAFVVGVLQNGIRYSRLRVPMPGPDATVNFFSTPCWKCENEYFVYMLTYPHAAACGVTISPVHMLETNEFKPAVVYLAKQAAAAWTEARLPFGVVKNSYSHTLEESYDAFNCPHCDAIFGQFYYRDLCMEVIYTPEVFEHWVPLFLPKGTIAWSEVPHWCWEPFCV